MYFTLLNKQSKTGAGKIKSALPDGFLFVKNILNCNFTPYLKGSSGNFSSDFCGISPYSSDFIAV